MFNGTHVRPSTKSTQVLSYVGPSGTILGVLGLHLGLGVLDLDLGHFRRIWGVLDLYLGKFWPIPGSGPGFWPFCGRFLRVGPAL